VPTEFIIYGKLGPRKDPIILPLSREVLIAQRSCCGRGCLNCPYDPKHIRGSEKIKDIPKTS